MIARKTGQRIRAGTLPVSSVTSAYEVEQIPFTADMDLQPFWTIDATKSHVILPARLTINEDGTSDYDGPLLALWTFGLMTFGMVSYWLSTYMSGVSFTGGSVSSSVTIMAYDETDTAIFIQCTMTAPDFTKLKTGVGCYLDVPWTFTNGVKIT